MHFTNYYDPFPEPFDRTMLYRARAWFPTRGIRLFPFESVPGVPTGRSSGLVQVSGS